MLFSIGYARLSVGRLIEIADGLDLRICDVRSRPLSRRHGFTGRQLAGRLGSRYQWRGDRLGGDRPIAPRAIAELVADLERGERLCLLCVEEAPGDCHRHHAICAPHFPAALHIYQDEIFTAAELSRAIAEDGDYEIAGSLDALLTSRRTSSPL